jgi:methionine sulfoxide reductase heme-binding subunit
VTLSPGHDQIRVETSPILLRCLACGAVLSATVGWYAFQNPPIGTDGFRFALRLTARASFVFWFLTFVAGPLASIQQAAASPLLRWRPRLGLAFAGAHLVHMGLVLTIPLLIKIHYPAFIIVFGGTGAIIAGMLALTSFRAVRKHIALRTWKLLHRGGIWYLGIMFSYGFLWRPLTEGTVVKPLYWPFTIAIVTALAMHGWRAFAPSGMRSPSRGLST